MTANDNMLRIIADLYYNKNQTQAEIAERLSISRPKVSRKLNEAREKGIVKIFIDNSVDDINNQERQLYNIFNLKGVKVISVPQGDKELALKVFAQSGAPYLSEFLNDGDHIGVSWGWTLSELTKCLPDKGCTDCSIVQLTGGVDNAKCHSFAQEIITNMEQSLSAREAFFLPCPALVENAIIYDILLHDAKIKFILDQGQRCDKMIANIALPNESSCLYQAGYLVDEDIARLKDEGAVGNICGRFFDRAGNICDKELNNRTIGISFDDLKKSENVISCIVGDHKAEAVFYALKAGLVNVLLIDSFTAEKIIHLAQQKNI